MALPKIPQQAQIPVMQQPIDPISQAYSTAPVEHGWTPSWWIKRQGESISQFLNGIVSAFKVAGQAGVDILGQAQWWGDLAEHPELLTRELERTGKGVLKGLGDQMIHTWGQGGLKAITHNTFDSSLDLLGALSLGSSLIRKTGTVAARMGNLKASVKLAKLADEVEALPGRMITAPAGAAYDAAMRVPMFSRTMSKVGLDPIGRETANLVGSIRLKQRAKYGQIAKDNLSIGLSKAERRNLNDIIDGMEPPEGAMSQRVLDRHSEWGKFTTESERLWKDLGVMTDEEMLSSRLKQTALRLKEKGIYDQPLTHKTPDGQLAFKQEALDFAKKWLDDNGGNPLYKPFMHERSMYPDEIVEALVAGDKSEKFLQHVGRFEKRTGAKDIIMDPDTWQTRAIVQTGELRASMMAANEVITRYGRVNKTGIASPGYKLVNPMMGKYMERGLISASEKLYQEATSAVRMAPEGQKGAAFIEAVKRVDANMSADPSVWRSMMDAAEDVNNWKIEIPDGAAFVLQKTMVGPNGLVKFYDNVLNAWRDVVLTMMPRYYVNNLLGNSVLMMFGGYLPTTKAAAMKEIDLPGEVLNSMGVLGSSEGMRASSFLPKWAQKAATSLQDASDIRPRQILFEQFSKEIAQHDAVLGDVVAKAGLATQGVENFIREMSRSRNELLESGEDLLIATRHAVEGKQLEQLAAKLQGGRPIPLTQAQESTVKQIRSEMMRLQHKIDTERSLSNMAGQAKAGTSMDQLSVDFQEALAGTSRIPTKRGAEARIADLQAQLEKKAATLQKINPSVPLVTDASILETAPDIARIAAIQARREYLAPMAAKAERAVRQVEQFLGNYGRLHPLEAQYIRRVIPFWTFARTMNKLVFQLPFIRPKISFLWNHYAKLMHDAAGDDRLPYKYAKNHIVIGAAADGNPVLMRIGGFNPFEAVKMTEAGGIPIPKFLDPTQNPIIKLAVESFGGFDTFTEKPFVKPTQFVHLDGTVYEFDPDTKTVKKVIPQKPIVDSLLQQIPHIRIGRELLDSLGGTARDVAGVSHKNADGTYTNDRSPWWAIYRAIGMPVTIADPSRIKIQHQMIVKGMLKRFQSAARRFDPETRAELQHIIEDLSAGGWEIKE